MDYAMPRAGDIPLMHCETNPVPTRTNPLGVKGAGEAGAVGAMPAVGNALIDALKPLGHPRPADAGHPGAPVAGDPQRRGLTGLFGTERRRPDFWMGKLGGASCRMIGPRRKGTRMGLMAGKQGLVMGVANDRSLAWGIAKAAHAEGARLAFHLSGRCARQAGAALAESLDSDFVLDADVTSEASLDALFAAWPSAGAGSISSCTRSLFPTRTSLTGKYLNTSRGEFSAHPRHLVLFVHRHLPPRRAADDIGRQPVDADLCRRRRVMPHYNVMGVAKAALEASVRYLRSISAATTSGSTRSRPGRSGHWPPPASATSATS
jgi:enoyl-[acyl-carrier-protein] reductase (NADH)